MRLKVYNNIMKNKVTVVIPTLNNVRGVKYLRQYFKDKSYDLIIVDNSKKNRGFAGGVNFGAKNVKTKWMLILNDDIEFQSTKIQAPRDKQDPSSKKQIRSKETIQRLINFAKENNLDAVSPILRNPNGKVENVGYRVLPIGKIELIKNFSFFSFQKQIDGLTAACLLVKTSVFKKLGGFDEAFFAYLEDVDFFLRFKKAGYFMGVAKDIEVLHNHMTTAKTMGSFKARQDMINWWRLYFKHPDKFKFNLDFIVERMRNVMGYIKAGIRISN